jgi:SAM-dependent methyltransferase
MMPEEARRKVYEGGFPTISAPMLRIGWQQYLDGFRRNKREIMKEVRHKDLQRAILSEVNMVLAELMQYDATEREFVVRVTAQEDRIPDDYNETLSWHVMPFANDVDGRRALEIGFGPGNSFCFFNDWDYLGLETSPRAIYYARKNPHSKAKQLSRTGEGKPFPLPNSSIDFVFADNSIQQIQKWQYELDECVRVLGNEGRLVFIERLDNGWPLPNIKRFHPDYNSPDDLASYLRQKGISVGTLELRGTYRGEVLIPDGKFEFVLIKGVKE